MPNPFRIRRVGGRGWLYRGRVGRGWLYRCRLDRCRGWLNWCRLDRCRGWLNWCRLDCCRGWLNWCRLDCCRGRLNWCRLDCCRGRLNWNLVNYRAGRVVGTGGVRHAVGYRNRRGGRRRFRRNINKRRSVNKNRFNTARTIRGRVDKSRLRRVLVRWCARRRCQHQNQPGANRSSNVRGIRKQPKTDITTTPYRNISTDTETPFQTIVDVNFRQPRSKHRLDR